MERNVISEINNGLQTAFFECNTDSNLAYRPQFITNDHKRGIKVLTHIENQLMHCDEFSISVAFISRSGFVELSETLKELERRGIKGRILTTDYLHFSDPYALDRLAALKNVELKMYHVDEAGVGFHTKGYLFRVMDDQELLKSAGLYGRDIVTGEEGYNLAAIMLLGKDDVILNVAPTYVTDALVRKVNVDRYDDREIIKTNLIESYNQLLEFGRKNLPDKFFLEGVVNKSLRNTIVREMVSNTLMHREFTSSYTAKFVIEKDRMYVENANRAAKEGVITVDNLDPNPKNPIIAAFFRNIGYADQLGSGVRKLFKYSKYYSGKDPQFVEDDVFRIIVPLDDSYSFDYGTGNGSSNGIETKSADKVPISADKMPINNLTAQQNTIFQFAKEKGKITSRQAEELLEVKQRRARSILGELVNMGILERKGMYKSTVYVLKDGKKNGNG